MDDSSLSGAESVASLKIKVKEKRFSNSEFIPEVIKFLQEGHTVTLQLHGFSMRPFLEDGRDKALLVKASNPKVGAPVLAEVGPGRYVLHRIVKITGDEVVLRGDGNLGVEHCRLADIKGEALGFYRKGRQRLDKTNGLKWRTYSFFWMLLLPLRRYILAVHRRVFIRKK